MLRAVFMRRFIMGSLLAVTLLTTAVSVFVANYDFPPDEDGITPIPLLRVPDLEPVTFGPVPAKPLELHEATFRVTLRWVGSDSSRAEREAAINELAAKLLPGFHVQPRPFAGRSWWRLTRVPLVEAPGFEFSHVRMPPTPDLSPYENATSEPNRDASGSRTNEDLKLMSPEMTLFDFHLAAADLPSALEKIDRFVAAVAEQTHARIRSDEIPMQMEPADYLARRAGRWVDGVPFAPAYVALAQKRDGRDWLLSTEGAQVLGLPELWMGVPDGILTAAQRHVLIAAVLQRMVENPVPDAAGVITVSLGKLKHPDFRRWATATLPPGAAGEISFHAEELEVKGGRVVFLRFGGDAHAALCRFAGCTVAASYKPPQ